MSYTCTGNASDLGLLATGLWQNNLNSPTSVSALTISGWFAQDYVVGQLNAKISTCYSGSNNGSGNNWAICPDADGGTLAILGAMYLVTYWDGKIAGAAGAGGVSDTWISLREGDSDLRRTSPAELMKVYSAMSKQANERLTYLTNEYIRNSQGAALPRSVEFWTIINGYPVYPP